MSPPKKKRHKTKRKPVPETEETHDSASIMSVVKLLAGLSGDVAGSAWRLAAKTGGASLKVGIHLLENPDQFAMLQEAGRSIRDLRQVAGLTLSEAAAALDIKDKSLLEAVEKGTATISFELILRMAALLARHDPMPFIIKFTRTYRPETWKLLQDWGVGRIPLHLERERRFINIYRAHDNARELSDEDFEAVLDFTRAAFEMALTFHRESGDPKT